MQTWTIYIGSNNDTKQLELDKIHAIAGTRHDGYTLYNATGAWLGKLEDTAVLIIHDEPSKLLMTVSDLKFDLEQDAIAYQVSPTLQFA